LDWPWNIIIFIFMEASITNKLYDETLKKFNSGEEIIAFLAHLSWKLKWAILIARCPSVCKLLHFRPLLQNHWANFNKTWHKSSLEEEILNCSNEGDCLSPREDYSKRVKIHWKIFFSRTSRPISIKLGTHYPWVKGIQVCSNKGPGPLQRGR
jgi:hypothetical protein